MVTCEVVLQGNESTDQSPDERAYTEIECILEEVGAPCTWVGHTVEWDTLLWHERITTTEQGYQHLATRLEGWELSKVAA